VDLKVDFEEREAAKADGAKWDSAGHTWYAPAGTDLTKVAQFLPANVKVDPSAMEAAREAKTQAIVVPKEIAAARAAQAARQTELQLDPVADKDMAEDAVLVGAMSQDDSELPPVDAYDDVSGF
jgi:hypothetical protein